MKILQYNNNYIGKEENKPKNMNPKNYKNNPSKNQIKKNLIPKSSKKYFPKSTSAEKLQTNIPRNIIIPQTDNTKVEHKNKYKDNNNINMNNNSIRYNQSNIIIENKYNSKEKKVAMNYCKIKLGNSKNINNNFQRTKINNNSNKKHFICINDISNDKLEKNFQMSSGKRKYFTYSNFIENLKIEMKNYENSQVYCNKKKKNIFSDFFKQFVNKTERNEKIPNTTNNSFYKMHSNDNNKKKIHKFNNIYIDNNISFYIKGLSTNNKKNIEDNYEKLKLKKELEIKDNKLTELLKDLELKDNKINECLKDLEMKDNKYNELIKSIEIQNNELIKINNYYNNIFLENKQLKEQIDNLKNNQIENNLIKRNDQNDNNLNININNSNNKEKSNYNNLITYNISKNNYNIINNEINNVNNYIKDNNIKEPIIENKSESLKSKDVNKEKEQEKKDKIERKVSHAFERFKRVNKHNNMNKEGEIQKSNKISNMAKMLENQISGIMDSTNERHNSVDVYGIDKRKKNMNDNFNNNIIDLIDNQPVINKKKKKFRSFSFDG